MKILKIIGLVIVGIIALALLTAAFTKSEFAVKREVTINKPKQQVYDYVKYLKSQDEFSVWNRKDPAMKKEFKGTDGTVGAMASWKSENKEVGQGEQTITALKEGEQVDFDLHFIEPFEGHDHAYFNLTTIDSTQTRVVWGFDGKMKYPSNLMLVFCDMDAMLGKDLQKGLDDLKAILEKK
ncbi:MAG: polyketide cyclase [Chitinophagaceae bacterium]|nr:polyketide cyclase [Chitinophagaceae bacterium]